MSKQIAIVTGASGGFGKEFVRLLSQKPDIEEIWAIARNEEKLTLLADEFGERIRPIPLDLSDRAAIEPIRNLLEAERPEIRWLVNNAGYAKFGSYADLDPDESLNLIDLNVGAVVRLGLTALPYMTRGSRLVNVASQAAFQPLPYQNLYSSTKAFVRNYTRALNAELKDRGITATAVCPGWMKTDLYTRAKIGAEKATTRFLRVADPAKVAKKAFRDAEKGKDSSVYGTYVKLAHLAAKLLPQKAMMRIWLHQQRLR